MKKKFRTGGKGWGWREWTLYRIGEEGGILLGIYFGFRPLVAALREAMIFARCREPNSTTHKNHKTPLITFLPEMERLWFNVSPNLIFLCGSPYPWQLAGQLLVLTNLLADAPKHTHVHVHVRTKYGVHPGHPPAIIFEFRNLETPFWAKKILLVSRFQIFLPVWNP